MKNEYVKDAAQDASEDVAQDVAEDVLAAVKNGGVKAFIVKILSFLSPSASGGTKPRFHACRVACAPNAFPRASPAETNSDSRVHRIAESAITLSVS